MKITNYQPFRIIGIFFILLALFTITGGHLALLQSVAWARMMHHYSTQGSFSSAMEKTFSGKYPCSLCKKIAKERQKEKTAASLPLKIKIDAVLETASFVELRLPKKFSYPKKIDSNYRSPIFEPPAPYPLVG